MVTIARFYWPVHAYLARCRLAACGIEAWLPDEYTTSILWQCSNFLGGIRLQVHPDDVDEARSILDDDPQLTEETIPTENEEATTRALRSAIFGVVQPLFYLWSLWLLVPLFLRRSPLNAIERRNVLLAFVLIAPPAVEFLLFTLERRL